MLRTRHKVEPTGLETQQADVWVPKRRRQSMSCRETSSSSSEVSPLQPCATGIISHKTTRHAMAPGRQCRHRQRPHHLRSGKRLRSILPRPAPPPETAVHRGRTGERRTRLTASRADQRPNTTTPEHVRFSDPQTRTQQ